MAGKSMEPDGQRPHREVGRKQVRPLEPGGERKLMLQAALCRVFFDETAHVRIVANIDYHAFVISNKYNP